MKLPPVAIVLGLLVGFVGGIVIGASLKDFRVSPKIAEDSTVTINGEKHYVLIDPSE